jgi:hypothetical protein
VKPFLYVGLALVTLGLFLLAPSESWRKLWRKLACRRSARPLLGSFSSFDLRLNRGLDEIHPRPAGSMMGCTLASAGNWRIENLSHRGPIPVPRPRRLTRRPRMATASLSSFPSSAPWSSQGPPIRGP